MRKIVYFIILFLCFTNSFRAISQNSRYKINYATSQITDLYNKFSFSNVGVWDNDLKEWRTDHPPYKSDIAVVINIGPDGQGNIFTRQIGHEKSTYPVVECKMVGENFVFKTWVEGIQSFGEITLVIKNNRILKMAIKILDGSTTGDSNENDHNYLVYFN